MSENSSITEHMRETTRLHLPTIASALSFTELTSIIQFLDDRIHHLRISHDEGITNSAGMQEANILQGGTCARDTIASPDNPCNAGDIFGLWPDRQHTTAKDMISLSVYLRGVVNTLAPIGRLPPEIMLRVFEATLPSDPTFLFSPAISAHSEQAVTTHCDRIWTQVCSAWRTLALSSPTLWTTLHSEQHPTQVLEYLRRSMSLPLNIYLQAPLHHGINSIQNLHRQPQDLNGSFWCAIIQEHAHRLRKLCIHAKAEEYITLSPAFNRPIPHLAYLQISLSPPSHPTSLGEDLYDQWIPPRLTSLLLESSDLLCYPSCIQDCNALRSVSLSFPLTAQTEEFLQSLQALPLYSLELKLHSSSSSVMSHESVLKFPSLKKLSIWGRAYEAAEFLEATHVPKSCRIMCTDSSPFITAMEVQSLAELLRHRYSANAKSCAIGLSAGMLSVHVGSVSDGDALFSAFFALPSGFSVGNKLQALRPLFSAIDSIAQCGIIFTKANLLAVQHGSTHTGLETVLRQVLAVAADLFPNVVSLQFTRLPISDLEVIIQALNRAKMLPNGGRRPHLRELTFVDCPNIHPLNSSKLQQLVPSVKFTA